MYQYLTTNQKGVKESSGGNTKTKNKDIIDGNWFPLR